MFFKKNKTSPPQDAEHQVPSVEQQAAKKGASSPEKSLFAPSLNPNPNFVEFGFADMAKQQAELEVYMASHPVPEQAGDYTSDPVDLSAFVNPAPLTEPQQWTPDETNTTVDISVSPDFDTVSEPQSLMAAQSALPAETEQVSVYKPVEELSPEEAWAVLEPESSSSAGFEIGATRLPDGSQSTVPFSSAETLEPPVGQETNWYASGPETDLTDWEKAGAGSSGGVDPAQGALGASPISIEPVGLDEDLEGQWNFDLGGNNVEPTVMTPEVIQTPVNPEFEVHSGFGLDEEQGFSAAAWSEPGATEGFSTPLPEHEQSAFHATAEPADAWADYTAVEGILGNTTPPPSSLPSAGDDDLESQWQAGTYIEPLTGGVSSAPGEAVHNPLPALATEQIEDNPWATPDAELELPDFMSGPAAAWESPDASGKPADAFGVETAPKPYDLGANWQTEEPKAPGNVPVSPTWADFQNEPVYLHDAPPASQAEDQLWTNLKTPDAAPGEQVPLAPGAFMDSVHQQLYPEDPFSGLNDEFSVGEQAFAEASQYLFPETMSAPLDWAEEGTAPLPGDALFSTDDEAVPVLDLGPSHQHRAPGFNELPTQPIHTPQTSLPQTSLEEQPQSFLAGYGFDAEPGASLSEASYGAAYPAGDEAGQLEPWQQGNALAAGIPTRIPEDAWGGASADREASSLYAGYEAANVELSGELPLAAQAFPQGSEFDSEFPSALPETQSAQADSVLSGEAAAWPQGVPGLEETLPSESYQGPGGFSGAPAWRSGEMEVVGRSPSWTPVQQEAPSLYDDAGSDSPPLDFEHDTGFYATAYTLNERGELVPLLEEEILKGLNEMTAQTALPQQPSGNPASFGLPDTGFVPEETIETNRLEPPSGPSFQPEAVEDWSGHQPIYTPHSALPPIETFEPQAAQAIQYNEPKLHLPPIEDSYPVIQPQAEKLEMAYPLPSPSPAAPESAFYDVATPPVSPSLAETVISANDLAVGAAAMSMFSPPKKSIAEAAKEISHTLKPQRPPEPEQAVEIPAEFSQTLPQEEFPLPQAPTQPIFKVEPERFEPIPPVQNVQAPVQPSAKPTSQPQFIPSEQVPTQPPAPTEVSLNPWDEADVPQTPVQPAAAPEQVTIDASGVIRPKPLSRKPAVLPQSEKEDLQSSWYEPVEPPVVQQESVGPMMLTNAEIVEQLQLGKMEVLGICQLGPEKRLVMTRSEGFYGLLAQTGQGQPEVKVLKMFDYNPLAYQHTFTAVAEGMAGEQGMFLTQVGTWRAIISTFQDKISLHTELG